MAGSGLRPDEPSLQLLPCPEACLADHRERTNARVDPGTTVGEHMLCRTRKFTPVLLLSAATLLTGGLAPAFVGVEAAQAASTKPSLDLCVVEPGFATPGDSFGLTTTGPKGFSNTATLQASACGSYKQLPVAGSFTVTQSQTPSGWHLAQIYCYSVGSAANANGTVDLTSQSATVNLNGPTACIFAELNGGGGGFSGGSGSSGGGSSGKSGTTTTTTTTTKPGTGIKPPPIVSICVAHPALCVFKKVGP